MCLQLHLATDVPLGLGMFGNLSLEEVEPARLHELRPVFSKRSIRHIGVDRACSCAFRYVLADGLRRRRALPLGVLSLGNGTARCAVQDRSETTMTTYTKRDIRAADLLAIILFGFGVVLAVFALFDSTSAKGSGSGGAVGSWLMAAVFLALGTALNLKVRQLIRTKGVEPKDYDGVPD